MVRLFHTFSFGLDALEKEKRQRERERERKRYIGNYW